MNEQANAQDGASAGAVMRQALADLINPKGRFVAECYSNDGRLKWREEFDNLVTTVGKNKILDTALGNAAGGAVIMGLKGTGAAAAGDTQASHAGWSEVGLANAPTYSGTRGSPSFSAASAGSKATSAAVAFSMTGAGTVAGCFINIGGTTAIDNTTGVLLSAGDFSASRTVANGDTVNVSYTLSV